MQTNTKDQVYAGFFVRLTAFLIDMIIVSVALAVIRVPMWFEIGRASCRERV